MHSHTSRIVYDFLEVVVPGGFFCGCLLFIYGHPAATSLNDWTLGALGVFLVLAYAVGHLVQTLSNTIEKYWWRAWKGMPIDWVRSGVKPLLPPASVLQLEEHLRAKLPVGPNFTIAGLDSGSWFYVTRQMNALVVEGRPLTRVTALEAAMTINRGLACAVFALSILFLLNNPFADQALIATGDYSRILIGIFLFFAGILTMFRMQRFSVQYALELFAQFVLLPTPDADPLRAESRTSVLSAAPTPLELGA